MTAAKRSAGQFLAAEPLPGWTSTSSEPSGATGSGASSNAPPMPMRWGWRRRTVGTGDFQEVQWEPKGDRVGWIEGEDVYLQPEAAYQAARRFASDSGDGFSLAIRTLHKRLHERGLLASTDAGRDTLTVRRMLEGRRHNVLHLRADTLTAEGGSANGATDPENINAENIGPGMSGKPDQPAQPDQGGLGLDGGEEP